MAEDSQSFAAAFDAKHVSSHTNDKGEEIHRFVNSQDKVPSRIHAGKIGDLSLRLGRYKLVRFNPPKDYRTGPSRQHINNHAGMFIKILLTDGPSAIVHFALYLTFEMSLN